MFFLLGPKTCCCGCSGVREGACRCSHSNTFLAEAYRTLSILKIIRVILVTFYELLRGEGWAGGSAGAPWARLHGLSCGLSWARLGSPWLSWRSSGPRGGLLALLGLHFGVLDTGPGNGNFLLQFAFKSDLKPVLVTWGLFD